MSVFSVPLQGVHRFWVMTGMWLRLQRALRQVRQDFSLATLRSAGDRAADRTRLIVRRIVERSWCGSHLSGVVNGICRPKADGPVVPRHERVSRGLAPPR
jgi:hypothetical protein